MQPFNNLSASDIGQLFDYCNKQGLKYYDVQMEVVDHMAAQVEAAMAGTGADFAESFVAVKRSFTKPVLKQIVNSRRKSIYKSTGRLFLTKFKSYFEWSKVPFTIFAAISIFLLPSELKGFSIFSWCSVLFIFYYFISLWFHGNIIVKNNTNNQMSLLSLHVLSCSMVVCMAVINNLPALSLLFISKDLLEEYLLPVRILTLLYLISLLSFLSASIELHKRIRARFPQAFFGRVQ